MINVNLNELSNTARRFFEESDPIGIENLFGDCKTLEQIEETANALYADFFEEDQNDLWYAVMTSREDSDWGTGSYDLEKAKQMVKPFIADGGYIAVIQQGPDPICIEEIRFDQEEDQEPEKTYGSELYVIKDKNGSIECYLGSAEMDPSEAADYAESLGYDLNESYLDKVTFF